MKEVKGISKRIKDAQKEEKLPLKKHQLLKQNQMSSKILTLKDLLPELQSYGINISKVTKLPESTLTDQILKKN